MPKSRSFPNTSKIRDALTIIGCRAGKRYQKQIWEQIERIVAEIRKQEEFILCLRKHKKCK